MSQRMKAHAFLKANGHGKEIKHLTTRDASAKSNLSSAHMPHKGFAGAQLSPATGMMMGAMQNSGMPGASQPDPSAPPSPPVPTPTDGVTPAFCRGGMVGKSRK